MTQQKPLWTPENVQKLLYLRNQGFTARQIAEHIGQTATKNAVIGRLHRMGLLMRSTREGRRYSIIEGIRKRKGDKDRRKKRSINARSKKTYLRREWSCKKYPLPQEIDTPTENAVTFADLRDHHCRYPFGEGSTIKFCGEDRRIGSYCERHHLKTHKGSYA